MSEALALNILLFPFRSLWNLIVTGLINWLCTLVWCYFWFSSWGNINFNLCTGIIFIALVINANVC